MLKNKWLKLDLQTFADKDAPPADDPAKETSPTDVTLSQDELDKKIELEADRKLAKALEKRQAEWDAKLEEKIAAERKSAEEYAKLSVKEKVDAEYNNRVTELEKREQELNNRQLLSQIESDLKENSLPASFAASLLLIGEHEQIKEAITGIKKDFDDAVAEKVKVALRQDAPPRSGGNIGGRFKIPSITEIAHAARIIK